MIKRLRDNARDKYRNLTEKEKNKKRKFGRNRYNISEKKKEIKTKGISKNFCGANKSKKSLKKQMHEYIHNKVFNLMIYFFISLYTVLAQ